jgi:pyridoxine kinase
MPTPISRIAAIHDLAGFGRAALSVVVPILATMGVQVCPLPTAVCSTHGMFPGCHCAELTDDMRACLAHWRTLDLRFDAVYSGFLASTRQIPVITEFIRAVRHKELLVVVDPVMGDGGTLYRVTDPELVTPMRAYIRLADVITPNLTEAALLLDEPYRPNLAKRELHAWLRRLAAQGPHTVIITSAPGQADRSGRGMVAAHQRDSDAYYELEYDRLPGQFPGTGDAFTSVILGSLLHGQHLPVAIERAVRFVAHAIRLTLDHQTPAHDGMLLEQALPMLTAGPSRSG